MKMERTKGPWEIWEKERELNPEISTGMPLIVAPPAFTGLDETTAIATVNADLDEYVANAHLIAAAPDLLGSCQIALITLQQVVRDNPQNIAATLDIKRIKMAIAKAKGR